MEPSTEPKKPSSTKTLIGLLIIVILLAVFYVVANKQKAKEITSINQELKVLEAPDPKLEIIETQSSSDTVDDIQKDLDMTDLEALTQ